MTEALGRVARVTVQQLQPATSGAGWFERGYNSLVVEGLRVSFRVTRGGGAKPRASEIRIYNLAERSRADLQVTPLAVLLEAGYASAGGLQRVVSGDVRRATTTREGVSVVTTIEIAGGDRAWRGAGLDRSYRRGAPLIEVLRDAARACGLSLPSSVETDPTLRTQLPAGYAATGGALQQLERLLARYGYDVSVQDGQLQILREDAARVGEAVVLRPEDLVGSPTLGAKRKLRFRTVLDPRIYPGTLVDLRSRDLAQQVYRVRSVQLDGDTRSGPWHTTCEAAPWKT